MTALREAREQANLSRRRLAQICGTTSNHVASWERGQLAPAAYRRPMLAKLLGLTEDQLNAVIEHTKRGRAEHAVAD